MIGVLLILSYILGYTKFGYNSKALKTGQKNAVDVGINEKLNAVLCYVIAGGLMGLRRCPVHLAVRLYRAVYGFV